MIALLKKELNYFFSTAIGIVFLSSFTIFTGLFLWVLDGDFNIFNSGFASLTPFFDIAPWIFLFLVPAIGMNTFAEEKKQGTIELLFTSPLSKFKIVFGKFLGVFIISLIAIATTFIYVVTVYYLTSPKGSLDIGTILGSYFALSLLVAVFSAISIFASALTKNQTIALIFSILGCFIFYYGFESLYTLNKTVPWDLFGINYHYLRISEGVIDTSDVIYFVSLALIFLITIAFVLKRQFNFNLKTLFVFGIITVMVIIGNYKSYRFDVTKDKRFTISESTKDILYKIEEPVFIDVLLEGKLPPEFKKLQRETKQLLESFSAKNKNVKVNFINVLEPIELRAQNLASLEKKGIIPAEVNTQFEGTLKKELVLPWAILHSNNKSKKVSLLKNRIGATAEERISTSIQNLEYAFTDAISLLTQKSNQRIAILKGNQQIKDLYLLDLLKSLQEKYTVRPFMLDKNPENPEKTLEEIKKYDLVINAKPIKEFSEIQKQILDQHLMDKKSQLHLIDMVNAEKDSIFNSPNFTSLTWINDLKVNDLFFSYGIRINPLLIDDLYSAPIVLAQGEGENTQYIPYNWGFSSIAKTHDHIISKNIEPVKFNFTSPIELLKNKTKKTVLLKSGAQTRLRGVPSELNLNKITTPKPKEYYNATSQNLGILLEDYLKSSYKNRILPFKMKNYISETTESKLIVISDGDIISNKTSKNTPLPLGYDPISKKQYGNKEFLVNAINYLLGNNKIVSLKAKQLSVDMLDLQKIGKTKYMWQWLNLALPIIIFIFVYLVFYFIRRFKFTF